VKKLTVIAFAAGASLAFSAAAMDDSTSKAEYKAAKENIKAEYKSAKAVCDRFSANAKDICVAEAKGSKKVALAELQETYHPGSKSSHHVRVARAKADYSLAIEKCDDMAGNLKDVCVKEAKAAYTAAKGDAKVQRETSDSDKTASEKSSGARDKANEEIGAARADEAADNTDADYAVAIEKCDALAGNDKDVCVDIAKERYGKS